LTLYILDDTTNYELDTLSLQFLYQAKPYKKTPLIYLFNTKVENELAKYSNTSFNTIMSMFIDAETCSSFIPSKSLFTSYSLLCIF